MHEALPERARRLQRGLVHLDSQPARDGTQHGHSHHSNTALETAQTASKKKLRSCDHDEGRVMMACLRSAGQPEVLPFPSPVVVLLLHVRHQVLALAALGPPGSLLRQLLLAAEDGKLLQK